MFRLPGPRRLERDAIYLGVLTAGGVKPLSRIEYPVAPAVLRLLRELGLRVAAVSRVAWDGSRVTHWALAREGALVERYLAEFDGVPLQGETPAVIRREAYYLGFPACCGEAYAQAPHARCDFCPAERALLFHGPCPGCQRTPALIPDYRAALAQAQRLHRRLCAQPLRSVGP